jgi:hypothetical protein
LSFSWVGFARIAAPRSAIQPDVASSNGETPSRSRSPAIALAPSYRSVVRSAGSAASRNRVVAASSPLRRRIVATAEQRRHLGRRERTNPRFERPRRRIDRRAQPCFQTGEHPDLTESHRRK